MAEHPDTAPPERWPQGTIRLTIQGTWLTSGPFTPIVDVSGHRVNSRFGTMDIPVWAGGTGSIGHEPQQRRAPGATIALVTGMFVATFVGIAWFFILLVWLAQR